MSTFSLVVGGLLPYLTVLLLVTGMAYRFYVWFKTPQPGKMTLFGKTEASTARGLLEEVLFLPSLFRGDKALWSLAWIFHASLALALLGHIRVFTAFADAVLVSLGMSAEGIDRLSGTAGGAVGILLLLTTAALLVRRVTVQKVREISVVPDYIALLLLVAIITTGDMMRFGAHFDLNETRVWASSLLTLTPVSPTSTMFLLHALAAQMLIIFIPFSKLMHLGGFFFTHALVKSR